jgi:hypothetical protein
MRTVQFKTTVEPVTELLEGQLQGALQIIAALVLTDAEADEMCEARGAEWAKSMREELLSPDWRPTLIKALQNQGFLTNTHPGFPLGLLERAPSSHWALDEAYKALEVMLQAYADGEGEDIPDNEDHKHYRAYWTSKLVEAGHEPEIAAWVLAWEGAPLACEAAMERIMRPVRAKKAGG